MEPVDLAEKGEPMYDFEEHEREPRLMLNAALYEAPGARHGAATGRVHRPKPKASRQRLPGRSIHAERKAVEKAATEKARPLTLDSFKVFAAQAAEVAAQIASGTRKEQTVEQGADVFEWYVDRKTGATEYRRYGAQTKRGQAETRWQDR
ncbi:hypothetical protein A5634_18130 [Mycobacterium asiaticum]|uniref:Uncharacterized protein n=1 Tax=Mycobacterium asiaticum TaxID=1790 RepID=A0A1A3P5T0_MYCAS|nr:hypothetical protein [Mycobacterium asiaticum]OBK29526.1 hypothetical protein A5634_18130 [Mycobacterium asiaticum]